MLWYILSLENKELSLPHYPSFCLDNYKFYKWMTELETQEFIAISETKWLQIIRSINYKSYHLILFLKGLRPNSDRIKYILSSFIERENNLHIDGVPFAYLFHKSKVRYTRYLKLPDIIGFIVIPQMYEKAQVNLVTILFTQLNPKKVFATCKCFICII